MLDATKACCCAVLLLGVCHRATAELPQELLSKYEAEVFPLVKKYCIECHNAETTEGALNLTELESPAKAVESLVWQRVVDRVLNNEMPPAGSPMPPNPEQQTVVRWIQSLISHDDGNCNKLASDLNTSFYRGSVMSRRLTRAEYNHSIRDLIGLDLRPADAFPADGSGGEGFDTVGDTLFTSTILLEKYIEAAQQVMQAALPDTPVEQLTPQLAEVRRRLLPTEPSDQLVPRDAARTCLQQFVRRAYRRPAADEDLVGPLKLFDKAVARGDSYTASMRLALTSVLSSPYFLFLAEPEPAESGVHPLAGPPLAARLAYFLWCSTPDDELLALGESGEITKDEVLKAQVQRMLADPRSRDMAANFTTQWLGLDRKVELDREKFPEFDAELAAEMQQEILAFAYGVFSQNRSLLHFLDAEYTYVSPRLALLYGVPFATEDSAIATDLPSLPQGWQKVALADRNRGGLTGMAGIHAMTSYPRRTSPVLRGKWVLADLLGNKVPPPPPDVPTLPPDDAPQQGLTLRQQFELHRKNEQCASCHNKIDPLGFALENFDPLGRWRNEIGGTPIDTQGQLPSGESFNSPAEMKQALLNRKHEFLRSLTQKMLCYALGREINRFDQCVIRETITELEQNEFRSSVLFEKIVLSYPFRHRYVKK